MDGFRTNDAHEENQRTYDGLKSMLKPGTFVAIDGAVLLIARSEVELNAKIVNHTPPLAGNLFVTCVGYEAVWAAPKQCL